MSVVALLDGDLFHLKWLSAEGFEPSRSVNSPTQYPSATRSNCFNGNSRTLRQADRLECLEARSNHRQCLAWMREAGKLRYKHRCLAVPCSHARERCRGRGICSLVPLLLVSLGVVFSLDFFDFNV